MTNSAKILELPALKVVQPIGEFYSVSMSARDLVGISYADVRRMADERREVERYLGIQRPLLRNRVKEIKKYLQGSDATFPTAVIIAIDERCATFDERTGTLRLEAFDPSDELEGEEIPFQKIAQVLDGQHRIAAFLDDNDEWDKVYDDLTFEMNVAVFIGADISEQANIFATVNLAQTKVNKSLVYDLTELSKSRSPHKTCHNVAVALDSQPSSPLAKRIKRLGTATPNRANEPLTQAAFVESLVRFISSDPVQDRNDLLDGRRLSKPTPEELRKNPFRNLFLSAKDVDIAEIIYNYFKAVEKKWPKSWAAVDVTGNLLPKSNAFKALMKFLKDDVYLEIVGDDIGRIPDVREFYKFFQPIDFADTDFTTKHFAPGSGGQSVFLKMLRGQITLADMLEK